MGAPLGGAPWGEAEDADALRGNLLEGASGGAAKLTSRVGRPSWGSAAATGGVEATAAEADREVGNLLEASLKPVTVGAPVACNPTPAARGGRAEEAEREVGNLLEAAEKLTSIGTRSSASGGSPAVYPPRLVAWPPGLTASSEPRDELPGPPSPSVKSNRRTPAGACCCAWAPAAGHSACWLRCTVGAWCSPPPFWVWYSWLDCCARCTGGIFLWPAPPAVGVWYRLTVWCSSPMPSGPPASKMTSSS